jgi:uncharacterized protein YndB with AHSA1/START domain
MPIAVFTVAVVIQCPPEKVFAYVADLSRHAEWAADPLQITALTPGPVNLGSRYRSTAQSHGLTFNSELRVTEYLPPERFAFGGADATGKFSHEFTFQPHPSGTRVTRRIQFTATLAQWLVFLLVLYPVRLPSARRTLKLLKNRLEAEH